MYGEDEEDEEDEEVFAGVLEEALEEVLEEVMGTERSRKGSKAKDLEAQDETK